MLITVAAFREPWEAHMFCSRLEAEGVPAFMVHEYHIGNAWHFSTALGGVKVQVFEEEKEAAKSIERRCLGGEFRSLLDSKFGTMDDVHCPNCGSHEYRKRRSFLRAVIAILLLVLSSVIVPPIGWVYFCNQCGTKFKQPLVPNTLVKWAMILAATACDLVILLGFVFCLWTLGTRYWFVVVVVAIIFAGRLTTSRSPRLDNNQD
jgi:hypothetical protein